MAKNDQNDNSMSTAEAGRMGGQKQGKENNPGNFANRDKEDVREAGRRGGESRGQQQERNEDETDQAA